MARGAKARWGRWLVAGAGALAAVPMTRAATLNWDTSSAAGTQATSGTWDFNTTADWSTNGTSLLPWSDNANLANFVLANTSSGSTVTISNANGSIGTAGLIFSGSTGSSGTFTLGGGSLQLGSRGIHHSTTNGVLTINAPLQLTASQTWTSNKSSAAALVITSDISSQSGHTTNLTFDGLSAGTGAGDAVTFTMGGNNSYSGNTIVTGSATLRLDYSTNNTAKLDPNSSLSLNNGKIILNGGSVTETAASTNLGTGFNSVNRTGGGATSMLKLGLVTRSAGASLDVNGGLIMLSNANTDGSTSGAGTSRILGGWATSFGGSGWIGSNGNNAAVATTNGSTFTSTSGWASTSNVKFAPAAGTYSITSNTSANVLQLSTTSGNITLNIDSAATLTLVSGGLMDSTNAGGSTVTGGKLTTGLSTGELFIYSPRSAGFNVGSQIVDNNTTPTVLVKGAANTLTLTGANTYTGRTYVNAGTLLLSGSAVGTVQGGLAVATNATFNPGGTYTAGAGKTVSGGGTIANSVDASGATLNPGDSTGSLVIQGGLTLDANSRINFDVNDFGTGSANDKIVLSTAADRSLVLDGTVAINDLGGLTVGNTYTLISGFTSIVDNSLLVTGVQGTVSFDSSNVYLSVTAVPEPSTLAPLGVGGLILLRRRRGRWTGNC